MPVAQWLFGSVLTAGGGGGEPVQDGVLVTRTGAYLRNRAQDYLAFRAVGAVDGFLTRDGDNLVTRAGDPLVPRSASTPDTGAPTGALLDTLGRPLLDTSGRYMEGVP